MNEREYKIGNLQLQLGSLNDELKQTITQVSHLHQEREKLLDEMEILAGQRKQIRQDVLVAKNSLESLRLAIRNESEQAEKNFQERKGHIVKELADLQHGVAITEKELLETQQGKVRAMAEQRVAEDERKKSLVNTAATLKEEAKVKARLDKSSAEMVALLDKLSQVEGKYEATTLAQAHVLKQIQRQESLLRDLTSKVEARKQLLSRAEEQLYATDTALHERASELKRVKVEYDNILSAHQALKADCKAELINLAKARTELKDYRKQETERIKQGLHTLEGTRKDDQKRHKDLKIIEARLRKHYIKIGLQFPKI